MLKEDGSRSSHRPQSSQQRPEQFNVICEQPTAQEIRSDGATRTTLATVNPIEYKGNVWCVQVPTGAFVARRNGHIFITGNSGFPKSLDIGKAIDKAAGNVTSEAEQWDGWGTALKPAHEPICMARKPLSESTVAANVLKWGTGGLNVDGCLIAPREEADKAGFGHYSRNTSKPGALAGKVQNDNERREFTPTARAGRFPANILLDEEAAAMLDEQSGGASRFFYIAKASKSERGTGNTHPTVKPVKLMRYLVRLITPLGGTVLDPFAGSGTTLLAAEQEGFDSIGIEMNPEYCEIIRKRMAHLSRRWRN